MTMLLLAGGPLWSVLFSLSLTGQPVRFGVPLPAAAVASGLALQGHGVLQWRRLPIGGAEADPVWVEIAIAGASGQVRVGSGGGPPCSDGRGPAFVRDVTNELVPNGRQERVCWRWCDGRTDTWSRLELLSASEIDGERYAVGEARSVWSDDLGRRAEPVCGLPRRLWEAVGWLSPTWHGAPTVQKHLALVLPKLREMPGARGAGDFLRSGEVVTNLEFDTTLALVQCAIGLSQGQPQALALARRCAHHLRDRDLDLRTGLPFPHGPEHRSGQPVPGHVWLQGMLWVGLLTADDGLLATAQNLGRALAACPPVGEGRQEMARDYAWPLLELEALLAIAPDPLVARAADRLAASIARRYDPTARTFRFGEGELGEGLYLERGWITGGLVVPALLRHLQRRPDAGLAEHVHCVQQALLDQIGRAKPGLPTHWRVAGGRTFAEHREAHSASAAMLLEAFDLADRRRLLRRDQILDCVAEVPALQDPDLATTFSMVARCRWVWR